MNDRSNIAPEVIEWLTRFADDLGVRAPTRQEIDDLLALAGAAARASQRQAAPIACWLAAQAGLSPAEALSRARALRLDASESDSDSAGLD